MKSITGIISALALSALTLSSQAATHTVNLSGNLSDAVVLSGEVTSMFSGQLIRYATWNLDLNGLGASDSFLVSAGDTIDIFVSLDGAFAFPDWASSTQSIEFFLSSSSADGSGFKSSESNVALALYLGNVQGPTQSSGCGFSSIFPGLCGGGSFSDAAPVRFDSMRISLQVQSVSSPFVVDGSSLTLNIQSPVPEAPASALMLAGLGLVFGFVNRKRVFS